MIERMLAPKVIGGIAAVAAATELKFGPTVSITAIIVAALVVVVGGIFTLRNNMKTFWRNLAEERKEQIVVLEDEVRFKAGELLALQKVHSGEILKEAEAQREVRHALKTELAGVRSELEIERAKHDLSAVTERIAALEDIARQRGEMFDRLDAAAAQTVGLLTTLVGSMLPAGTPPTNEEVPAP